MIVSNTLNHLPPLGAGTVFQVAGPCVIMIEDVHTMDDFSWKLLQSIHLRCPALWLAVSLRPAIVSENQTQKAMWTSLTQSENVEQIVLAPFTVEGATLYSLIK